MQIFDKVNVQLHRVAENHRTDPKSIGLQQWNFLSYSIVHRNVCFTSLNFMFESLELFMVRLENIGLQKKHLDQLIARHDYVKTSSCNLSSQQLPLYSHLRLGDDTVIKGHCAVLPTGCGCERVWLQMCCIKLPCCDDIQQEKETPNRLTYSESPSVHSSPLPSQPNTPPPMQPSTADPSMSECTKGHGRKQALAYLQKCTHFPFASIHTSLFCPLQCCQIANIFLKTCQHIKLSYIFIFYPPDPRWALVVLTKYPLS